MTTVCAIRVPGAGVVMAGDGRVCEANHIVADDFTKVLRLGTATAAWAGTPVVGNLLIGVQGVPGIRRRLRDAEVDDNGFEVLMYDGPRDILSSLDSSGTEMTISRHYATGSGRAFALGYLDSFRKPPADLKAAAARAKRAVRIAAARDVGTGGRILVVVQPHQK